ncbi:MAG: PIN domain-containing protein [Acidobacteriia bacterium]|nr:PIN domain-containing protein [Terriglobia bacterium]
MSYTIEMRFVDSNILIYAIASGSDEREKSERALRLLEEPDLATSVQVLQEFYVQATCATRKHNISHKDAVAFIQAICEFPVQEVTVGVLQAALATKHRYQISYWDAAIIEAARALGCREILSEDLSDGQDYGGVRVRNPFR